MTTTPVVAAAPKTCAPWIAGILVLLIGAYVVWRMIQFCQEHFAKLPDPPAPEPNVTNVVDEAAFILQPSGSQPVPGDSPSAALGAGPTDGCLFQFAIMLLPDGGICLTNCAIPQMETKAQLDAEVAGLGLSLNKTTAPGDIHWDGTQLTVGSGEIHVVIERSMDLVTWKPVATNNIPADRIVAATLFAPCGTNCFWRAAR